MCALRYSERLILRGLISASENGIRRKSSSHCRIAMTQFPKICLFYGFVRFQRKQISAINRLHIRNDCSFCPSVNIKISFHRKQPYFLTSTKIFHDGFKRHSFKSMTARNSSSLSSETANEKKAAIIQSSLLKQRFIYVQTSVERWQDIPGGVFLDTAYLDSSPGDRFNPGEPVVVGLHSSPGSFYDLQPLLDACVKSGCRVLAPSFPGVAFIVADHLSLHQSISLLFSFLFLVTNSLIINFQTQKSSSLVLDIQAVPTTNYILNI